MSARNLLIRARKPVQDEDEDEEKGQEEAFSYLPE